MEDRTTVYEMHGIANARKVAAIKGSDVQTVYVTDHPGEVLLSLGYGQFPAGLTPAQAEMVAQQLSAAAVRVRARKGKAP